ncbi:hypothetical protein K7X08_026404 [Anisodus acutangulus]|uniref:Uncharacterized protein n=1 Tax=Anisodus acutangulus TaxID=402998 RepID=A0A9Q1LLK7_9SOLA|nr:hypothetical protein K7X08_026404 [Anisodus acutangulus]
MWRLLILKILVIIQSRMMMRDMLVLGHLGSCRTKWGPISIVGEGEIEAACERVFEYSCRLCEGGKFIRSEKLLKLRRHQRSTALVAQVEKVPEVIVPAAPDEKTTDVPAQVNGKVVSNEVEVDSENLVEGIIAQITLDN